MLPTTTRCPIEVSDAVSHLEEPGSFIHESYVIVPQAWEWIQRQAVVFRLNQTSRSLRIPGSRLGDRRELAFNFNRKRCDGPIGQLFRQASYKKPVILLFKLDRLAAIDKSNGQNLVFEFGITEFFTRIAVKMQIYRLAFAAGNTTVVPRKRTTIGIRQKLTVTFKPATDLFEKINRWNWNFAAGHRTDIE